MIRKRTSKPIPRGRESIETAPDTQRALSLEELAERATQPDRLEQAIAAYESAKADLQEMAAELHEAKAEASDLRDRLQALETATAPLLERSDEKPGKQP